MQNVETYHLEKSIWNESDFDRMGWHDARLWAMVAHEEQFEFALDLDYIFKWVHPGLDETYFKFWVAPVTMVFENVHQVEIDIESQQGIIEISDLHREAPTPTPNGELIESLYRFECQEGEISLKATGFTMYVRQTPRLLPRQSLTLEERNGISVARTAIPL